MNTDRLLSPGLRTAVLALAPSLMLVLPVQAQREWGGEPPSLQGAIGAPRAVTVEVPTLELPAIDPEQLLAEDALAGRTGALRFARAQPVDIDANSAGQWTDLEGGARLWRLRLYSPGARSLAVAFDRFQLPEGAEFFVFDDSASVVRGAYTSRNHKPDGRFAVRPTAGDALNLEYWEPAGAGGSPELRISAVFQGYRQLAGLGGGAAQGPSGPCQIDVVCPEGAPYTDQVEAVVQISSGLLDCSGALINNTAEDGRLLVLTAEHCGDLSNAIFAFDFEEATCGGSGATITQTVQGSRLLVKDAPLDFQLIELLEQPAEAFGIKYLGWDRSDGIPAAGSVALHHPNGDAMKIAVDMDPPSFSGTFWHIADWEVATTEPGSSGSPLLDTAGRFIGQLSFGTADCTNPSNDNFGRLAQQWTLVAPFLDPVGTGQLQLDLYDPNAGSTDPLAISAISPDGVPALLPGTGEDVTLLGSGFQDGMTLSVDGISLTAFTRRTSERLTLDMPEVANLGPVDVVLNKGTESVTFSADVVAPDPIAYQAGTGDAGNSVGSAGGVDLILGGTPGDLHLVIWSFSNVPSVHPLWTIEIGNNFTDLMSLGCFVVGVGGTTTFNVPISGIAFTSLYSQTTNISGGAPFEVSNLQEIFVVF